MLHQTSDLLVRQRTMLINALRAHLGEVAAKGSVGVIALTERVEALAATGA